MKKMIKKLLSTVMSVCMAVLVIASNTVTAANPNEINLDFTTAAGVSAAVSVTGAGIAEFDSEKGAAHITAGKAFNAYFSNTDTQNNVRVTEFVFETNGNGNFTMQYRPGPVQQIGARGTALVFNNNTDNGKTLIAGHKYLGRSAYNYNTLTVINYIEDLTDGSLKYTQSDVNQALKTYSGYKVEANSSADGAYIYSFKSYEMSITEYNNLYGGGEAWDLDYDFSKNPTVDSKRFVMTKAQVSEYNGTKSLNFEQGGSVNAFPASDMKKVYMEASVLVDDEQTGAVIDGAFGSQPIINLVSFTNGGIYAGTYLNSANLCGEYAVKTKYDIKITVDLTARYYTVEVLNGTDSIAKAMRNIPADSISRFKLSSSGGSGMWLDTFRIGYGTSNPITLNAMCMNDVAFVPGASMLVKVSDLGDELPERVELYDGAAKIGEVTSAPYEFTLSNLSEKTYVLTANAYYADGSIRRAFEKKVKVCDYNKTASVIAQKDMTLTATAETNASDNIYFTAPTGLFYIKAQYSASDVNARSSIQLVNENSEFIPVFGMKDGNLIIAGADVTVECEANKAYDAEMLFDTEAGTMNISVTSGGEAVYFGYGLNVGNLNGVKRIKAEQAKSETSPTALINAGVYKPADKKEYRTERMEVMESNRPVINISDVSADYLYTQCRIYVTNNTDTAKNADILVAIYDKNGILTDCKLKTAQQLGANAESAFLFQECVLGADSAVKAFVFDSIETAMPLAHSFEIK